MITDADYIEMARQDYQFDDGRTDGEACLIAADPLYETKNGDEDVSVLRNDSGGWVLSWVWVANSRFEIEDSADGN